MLCQIKRYQSWHYCSLTVNHSSTFSKKINYKRKITKQMDLFLRDQIFSVSISLFFTIVGLSSQFLQRTHTVKVKQLTDKKKPHTPKTWIFYEFIKRKCWSAFTVCAVNVYLLHLKSNPFCTLPLRALCIKWILQILAGYITVSKKKWMQQYLVQSHCKMISVYFNHLERIFLLVSSLRDTWMCTLCHGMDVQVI